MAPAETILDTARRKDADLVGLSGLITPSLDEMVHVAREMERQGFVAPLLIGGATTSKKHTAVKIAPEYSSTTVHVAAASRAVEVVGSLVNPVLREGLDAANRREQDGLRRAFAERSADRLLPYLEAVKRKPAFSWDAAGSDRPPFLGTRALPDFPLAEIVPYIDWTPFFHVWDLRGVFPRILDHPQWGKAARELHESARSLLDEIVAGRLLRAAGGWGFFPAASRGVEIVIFADVTRTEEGARLPMLRQQREKADGRALFAVSDFVAPLESRLDDHVGAFAVTAGIAIDELVGRFERDHDDYRMILAKALADRL